jgi:hypothetical protein
MQGLSSRCTTAACLSHFRRHSVSPARRSSFLSTRWSCDQLFRRCGRSRLQFGCGDCRVSTSSSLATRFSGLGRAPIKRHLDWGPSALASRYPDRATPTAGDVHVPRWRRGREKSSAITWALATAPVFLCAIFAAYRLVRAEKLLLRSQSCYNQRLF